MKISELRQKKNKELENMLREKHDRLCQMRFQLISGKVKNVKEVRNTRKEIARILTLLEENK